MRVPFDKTAVRAGLLDARNSLTTAERRDYSKQICHTLLEFTSDRPLAGVFVYVSLPDEVDTRLLIDEYVRRGVAVAVPRIVSGSEMRAVAFPGWDAMEPGPLKILAPHSRTAYAGIIDVAIVPGLGFTRAGARIGFGAGYYDRWLAGFAGTLKIGVAFECQIRPDLPQAEHDVRMDRVVTETG